MSRLPIAATQGFSLIETLVSMAILALMVVLIAEIISMSGLTVSGVSKRQDSGGQSRFALDRLAADLESSVIRTDVPFEPTKAAGNDSLNFYSQVEGYSGNRRVAAVSYRIRTSGKMWELERGVRGFDWTFGQGIPFQANAVPPIDNSDFEILAESILRLELCYLKTDGSLGIVADPDDVSAVIVAVAALDQKTRKTLTADEIETLSQALPDAEPGKEPIATWEASGVRNGVPGVSTKATQALRFYQRYYRVR